MQAPPTAADPVKEDHFEFVGWENSLYIIRYTIFHEGASMAISVTDIIPFTQARAKLSELIEQV